VQYVNTGSYFGRVKIGGKTFREGLDTDVFTAAKLWVPALIKERCKIATRLVAGTIEISTEFMRFCRRGTLPASRRVTETWWNWKRQCKAEGMLRLRAKPKAVQNTVESASLGHYSEMFARRKRHGWHSWRNEVSNDVEQMSSYIG
jgi:hypothetical protein